MARPEMGAGGDRPDLPVLALMGADRMAGLVDILVHSGKVSADPGGDHRLGHRLVLGIIKADLAERQMRRHDDMAGADRAAVGHHPVGLVIDRAAVFEDVAALAGDGAGKAGDVAGRVELGLAVEAQGGGTAKGRPVSRVSAAGRPHRRASSGLLLDLVHRDRGRGCREGRLLLDIGVDADARRRGRGSSRGRPPAPRRRGGRDARRTSFPGPGSARPCCEVILAVDRPVTSRADPPRLDQSDAPASLSRAAVTPTMPPPTIATSAAVSPASAGKSDAGAVSFQ